MSEQVISLTSSDEEENTEPLPKKRKTIPLLLPQVTLSVVKVKKKPDPIETVTLDSDEEVDQPKAASSSLGINNGPSSENVDLITLTDDEEDVQSVSSAVSKVNALIESIVGTDQAQIVSTADSSNVCQDKSDTVSIIDSDNEAETNEEQPAQPETEAPSKNTTDTNENVIADADSIDQSSSTAQLEAVDKDASQIGELTEKNANELNETDIVHKEEANIVDSASNDVANELNDSGEVTTVTEADKSLELITVEENVDSIVIDDSDEETEKENHCENVDIEPFPVTVEKTTAADAPGPSTSAKAESFETRAKTFKKFLKVVEEKIVDSSFEEILPKKVPIIQKYFKRCGSYVNDTAFETFLKDSISSIEKAPNSNAANTSVLAFHKIFEHLKSHVAGNTVEIEEDHVPKVKKLEKTMRLLRKRIKKLEETEVNFDDDEDSAYIMLDRYQARLNKVYVKYCEYLRRNPFSGRAIYDKISFVNSKHNKINQAISRKYKNSVNFPSYYDLEKYIEKTVRKEKLELSQQEIKRESKKCFKYLGSILQKKRRQELYDSHLDFIEFSEDPATKDISLENVLKKNYSEGKDKIEKLYQKYVNKQEQGEDHVSSDDVETTEESDSEENKNSKKKGKRKSEKEKNGNENGQLNAVENCSNKEKESDKKEDTVAANYDVKNCTVEVSRADEDRPNGDITET